MKYIRMMRIDHWIKQLFILPGYICALILTSSDLSIEEFWKLAVGFGAVCIIASANYIINEYLDAEFDKLHPTKKIRAAVSANVNGMVVWLLWGGMIGFGILVGAGINHMFVLMLIWLCTMGVLYNVRPFRTKDIAIVDVLSESLNNAIRLLLGWFIVSSKTIPPCSLLLGYWLGGAFLMAIKRYAEYRMIADPVLAGRYRRSFKWYSEKRLLTCALFYAMSSTFFIGVFLVKYKIELVLLVPVLIGLFSYYFSISFKIDSPVQRPEKLYREKGLMLYCAVIILLFIVLMFIDIPWLNIFLTDDLVTVHI